MAALPRTAASCRLAVLQEGFRLRRGYRNAFPGDIQYNHDLDGGRDDRDEAHPDAKLLDRAQAQFREIMSRHRKPEVDEDKLAKVREVVARARRELVG